MPVPTTVLAAAATQQAHMQSWQLLYQQQQQHTHLPVHHHAGAPHLQYACRSPFLVDRSLMAAAAAAATPFGGQGAAASVAASPPAAAAATQLVGARAVTGSPSGLDCLCLHAMLPRDGHSVAVGRAGTRVGWRR